MKTLVSILALGLIPFLGFSQAPNTEAQIKISKMVFAVCIGTQIQIE